MPTPILCLYTAGHMTGAGIPRGSPDEEFKSYPLSLWVNGVTSLDLPQLSLGRGCGANPHQAEPSRLSPVPSWCVFWQWTPAFLSWTRATAPAPTHRRGCRHGHSSNIFPGDCSTSHCIDCIYCLCPSFLAFPWCSEGLSFDECIIINISNWYNISACTYFEFAAGK